jgi:distribution and morphology protein 34
MAFNFNWSPLIADTDRVRDMLTTALNKSPKPPIIVDDILVNELNLGSTPPELEILEIGDLAEDRFRGIFKMSYTGDAYLTLKTRVQANPLNTYLSTKPSFTSPQPLAASSSLTIPLQITLSDIRLSGFVILVFSKQKGITLVFRNDPLESLKVSSTFDAIPFVRDYLQKTIENQLRVLFMEDLPAIIHKLSLRMFNSEYQVADIVQPKKNQVELRAHSDPFGSAASLGSDDSNSFSLDPPTETYATFSQKNLLRLAALSESQRTLSLFTPRVRDTVYRAWSNTSERKDTTPGTMTPTHRTTTLSRIQSSLDRHSAGSSVASENSGDLESQATRPTLQSISSTTSLQSLGTSRSRPHRQRKRKNRVVDLRKKAVVNDSGELASVASSYEDASSVSGSHSHMQSVSGPNSLNGQPIIEREGELETPPRSPIKKSIAQPSSKETQPLPDIAKPSRRPVTPHKQSPPHPFEDEDQTPRASIVLPNRDHEKRPHRSELPRMQTLPAQSKSVDLPRSRSDANISRLGASFGEGSTGGILEQAWMMKMAHEIANRVAEEKSRTGMWRSASSEDADRAEAPPAYVS